MKLILLTHPISQLNEIRIIENLLGLGLEEVQIHRTDWSDQQKKKFINSFPEKFRHKIKDHGKELKFHSLEELNNHKMAFKRAFLSPIFDSISKQGHKSTFELTDRQVREELRNNISGKNLIALGGINEHNIAWCGESGFSGVAVLGAIWEAEEPVKEFIRIRERCNELNYEISNRQFAIGKNSQHSN